MVSASASLSASKLDTPLLSLLRRYRNTSWDHIWGKPIGGLIDEIDKCGARKVTTGPLGQSVWSTYPAPGSRLARPRVWVEAEASLLGTPADNDDTPIGVWFQTDFNESRPGLMSATFVVSFGGHPIVCPSRVFIDTRSHSSSESKLLAFADFQRARLGLPLARDATEAELLACDEGALLVDEKYWIRAAQSPLTKTITGAVGPHYAIADEGPEGLRAAHASTVVEAWVPPPALSEDQAEAFAELEPHRISFTLFRRVLARGPFLALTALALAAQAERAAA